MAEAEQKQEQKKVVSRIKLKKKYWFPILAPTVFGEREIGESYLPSAESGKGRVVDIALKEITGNVRDQNAYVRFKIAGVKENRLLAETIGYSVTPSYVRRAVKKETNRIDGFVTGQLKDGRRVEIKTLLITFHKIQRSLRARLQRQTQAFLREEMKNSDWDAFISSIAYTKVQQALRKKLLKLYPLREVTLRAVNLQVKKRAASRQETAQEILSQEEEAAEVAAEQEAAAESGQTHPSEDSQEQVAPAA